MIQRYSRALNNSSLSLSGAALPHCSFSNVGKAVEDCMRAVIGVLLNLTHDNGILNHNFYYFFAFPIYLFFDFVLVLLLLSGTCGYQGLSKGSVSWIILMYFTFKASIEVFE